MADCPAGFNCAKEQKSVTDAAEKALQWGSRLEPSLSSSRRAWRLDSACRRGA